MRHYLVLWFAQVAVCRVLVDTGGEFMDYGHTLQYKGVNFSVNGNTGIESPKNCTNTICSEEIQLPLGVEETIYRLLHNTSYLDEETEKWLHRTPKFTSSINNKSDKGVVLHHRQKRFLGKLVKGIGRAVRGIGRAARGLVCFLFSCGSRTTIITDPHAKERYLMEKERTKMETISFCYNTCAKEWSQWGGCTQPCGKGTQTRTRQTSNPPNCDQKFKDYGLGSFSCPFPPNEARSCNEGCPNGGEMVPASSGNSESTCLCFGRWGGTCCTRELFCQYPGQPANGEIISTTSPSPVGSVAMFNCNPGFKLIGDRYSVCTSENEEPAWVPDQPPTCQRIVCSAPVLTEHLQVLNPQDSYNFGRTVHFKCEDGFVLEGPDSQTCKDSANGEGRWSLYRPYCIAGECPAPTRTDFPLGTIQGADYSFNASIAFTCRDGYERIGLSTLTCTKHGRWNGFFPTCEEITCPAPYPPLNGDMQLYGTDTVVFSCQEGYRLTDENNRVATCQDDGQWSIVTPNCQAIECDSSRIEQIENGYRNGNVFRYPFSVQFGCYPGYTLQGNEEISCQDNGEWSGEPPTCLACPLNTYMDDWSTGGVCLDCPENSRTTTVGSTNRQQCICDDGYSGPNGGPCQEVLCTLPNVPVHGSRGTCELNVGQTCAFTCDPGYIPSSGSNLLQCLPNGQWSNEALTCTACPMDTYNPEEEPNVCSPCPAQSSTEGLTGQVLQGCQCTLGWEGPAGGPCADVNECELSIDGLACEDECVNTDGSFYCDCSVPGFELGPDGFSCTAVEQCRELTTVDAPSNGALVCNYYEQYNSRYCAARCNEGFDFAGTRPNNYETCGPNTGFQWTFELNDISEGVDPTDSRINDCVTEFFPGIKLFGDIFYLSGICEELTEEQQTEVKEAFVQVLMDDAVCTESEMSCRIDNVDIICGRREKRDADGNLWKSIDFAFQVKFANVTHLQNTADCDSYICPMFRIPARYCQRYCATVIKNYAKGLIKNAENKLKAISEDMSRIRFTIVNQVFQPEAVNIHGQNSSCPRPGQAYVESTGSKEAYCVSCKAGEYLSEEGVCELCAPGTHQLLSEQTSCPPCPLGSYSEEGWEYCLTCNDGFYGNNCQYQCSCVNGECDMETGECHCHSGWEGPSCTVDPDRCEASVCPSGTTCQDKHPPEDGFICVNQR